MIFGREHILSAFEHAQRSIHRHETSTHSIQMELLLYASGERQIKHAIEKMGVKKGKTNFVAIFLFTEEKKQTIDTIIDMFYTKFHIKKNELALLPNESKLSDYGISQQAIESVKHDQKFQLILEKIALVDVIK
jgi:KEOPS complex subunit Cgi121